MTANRNWMEYVRVDGTLGGAGVLRRETIYVSPTGNKVERFHDGERSYIFKPVSYQQTVGRERWAHDTIISRLSDFNVPPIVASSDLHGSGPHWLIYEDLGMLRHCTNADELIEAAGWIAEWRRLPTSLVPAAFAGHSPYFDDVLERVLISAARLHEQLIGCSQEAMKRWADLLPDAADKIGSSRVVSHGDYHPYNVAIRPGERIVLDWEFVHLNHPWWDIYSLLDITSPRYAKAPLTQEQRIAALRRYWDRSAGAHGGESFDSFCEGYWIYASVFSAWIAGLIEGDIGRGEIPLAPLLQQKQETSGVFVDCLYHLGVIS